VIKQESATMKTVKQNREGINSIVYKYRASVALRHSLHKKWNI